MTDQDCVVAYSAYRALPVVAAKPAPDFAGRNRATWLGIPDLQVTPSDTMTTRGNSGPAARHYRKD